MSSTQSPYAGQRVLVTGAGGFIGSHLVEALVREGATVRAFVRYTSSGTRGNLDGLDVASLRDVEVVFGDVRDGDGVAEAMAGCDKVFHLAALIAIPYSYVHPREFVDVNIGGTLNVLAAAQRHDAWVINVSTSEVYGTARSLPIDEDHPLQPQSPYSASKIGAEALADSFFRSFDLPVVMIRPFNAFGPRQSRRAVIPSIISQALQGELIQIGNTSAQRDFTFVEDTAMALAAAGRTREALGVVINVGSGDERSILDLVGDIGRLLGKQLNIQHEQERVRPPKSEVDRLLCDSSRARTILGWAPQVGYTEGLARTIDWWQRQPRPVDVASYVR